MKILNEILSSLERSLTKSGFTTVTSLLEIISKTGRSTYEPEVDLINDGGVIIVIDSAHPDRELTFVITNDGSSRFFVALSTNKHSRLTGLINTDVGVKNLIYWVEGSISEIPDTGLQVSDK